MNYEHAEPDEAVTLHLDDAARSLARELHELLSIEAGLASILGTSVLVPNSPCPTALTGWRRTRRYHP
ncbi:hypothetical protein [Streptomyces sp. CFMR 7]|uniref:hypothetical protein n=1 Tax=Streptomyces sp. CFMR 7 TaxID=1649184 RepID=UPI00119E3360|nr:hypothetical protein [Streptomyces sp. CFMR 7]